MAQKAFSRLLWSRLFFKASNPPTRPPNRNQVGIQRSRGFFLLRFNLHCLLATKEQLQFWGSGRSSPKLGIKTLCSAVTQEAEPATSSGRSCATSHPSVPLFQGKSANPQHPSHVPNRIIPPQQHREAEGEGSWAPRGRKHSKMSNHGWPSRQMGEGKGELTVPVRLL